MKRISTYKYRMVRAPSAKSAKKMDKRAVAAEKAGDQRYRLVIKNR